MSYSFDTASHALTKVREAENLTESQRQIVSLVQDFIDELHTKSHEMKDELNRGRIWQATKNIEILLEALKEGKTYFDKYRELNPRR